MFGAPNPSGNICIADISPGELDWTATDIAHYLEAGLKPDYDSAEGKMVPVITNMRHLTNGDRAAIAPYSGLAS